MAVQEFQKTLSYPTKPDPVLLPGPLAEDKCMFLSTPRCLTCLHLEQSIQLLCQAAGCKKCHFRLEVCSAEDADKNKVRQLSL